MSDDDVIREFVYPHERDRGRTIVRIKMAEMPPEAREDARRQMQKTAGRILYRHYMEQAGAV